MMKKIFSIVTAVMVVAVITLLVTIACVKKNVPLECGEPYRIMVYNHSSTAIKSPSGDTGFEKGDEAYDQILSKLNEATNLSILDWLVHENTLDLAPSQDLDNKFSKYSTEMKTEYIAIELWFANDNAQQDLVVWIDGDSKVVSFDHIILIIPTDNNNYNDIVAYFSLGSNDWETQYRSCQPVVFKGRAGALVDYIKTLK